jgi:DNA-binding transcriptional MerR regulator
MEKQYLVKEFARLARTTVRTLHYYEQVGLLKPARRGSAGYQRSPGYRVYTDADLLRLQQIVTLKFMGFKLSQIKELLGSKGYEAVRALRVQAAAVKDEVARLQEAARAIDGVLKLLETRGRIHRRKLIKIMEVIQMGEDVKKKWHEKFYTEAELKEFEEVGKRYTPAMIEDYQRRWRELIEEVKRNLGADPAGEVAQSLARRWADLFQEAYGGRPRLEARIKEAYASGTVPREHAMFGPEVMEFIKKALAARK